jgi:alpha-tubulin suppressor-like RCC1 family protein
VQGPQRLSWSVRLLRARGIARRRIVLTFTPTARAPRAATVVLSARARHGRLLGRRRVTISYVQQAAAVAPPPLPLNSIVGWGTNGQAEVGTGYRSDPVTTPVAGLVKGVRQVVASYKSGYALLDDGTIRSWGSNDLGQLGDGTRTDKITPTTVQGLTQVVQIAAGGEHAMALLSNGTVFTWGGNLYGMLGNGTQDPHEGVAHPLPVQVPGLSGVVAINAGGADDVAVLANGTAVAWGENKTGQLGDGTTKEKLVPTPITGLANVRSVAIGGIPSLGGHMLALLANGTVFAAGQNGHGQLGLGDTSDRVLPTQIPALSNVTAVSASPTHSLAIASGGALFSWGLDADGELGYAPPEACEGKGCGRVPRPVGLTSVSAIAAGLRFSVALREEQAFSWGTNEAGQLGTGTTTPTTTPLQVPGIAGITSISATEKFALGTVREGPSPDLHVVSQPGGLLLQWTPLPGSEQWTVSWRAFTKPRGTWSKRVFLSGSASSYVISGLSPGVLYEVRLTRVGEAFGYRVGWGIPG